LEYLSINMSFLSKKPDLMINKTRLLLIITIKHKE
jgi:hypothetical protein